jgi:hypothetical protein
MHRLLTIPYRLLSNQRFEVVCYLLLHMGYVNGFLLWKAGIESVTSHVFATLLMLVFIHRFILVHKIKSIV